MIGDIPMNVSETGRREFMKRALATSSLLVVPDIGLGLESAADRTAWYRHAKFGMFIHWGPYSLASVEASWPIMTPSPGGITQAEYVELRKRFNPSRFDPYAFVDLARAAGQQYLVFTTKHHDGFCMFDSSYTDYKITNSPYGKDIVRQLAAACKERGMPLGFYYSPPDLHHPAFRDTTRLAKENWHGEPTRPEWPLYLKYMQLQLTELLTNYGDVAIVWFDGLNDQQKYSGQRFLELIHKLQPATLVNDRIGQPGDYQTPEQFIPTRIPTKNMFISGVDPKAEENLQATIPKPDDFQLWETCMTINSTWAYNKNDHDYKSAQFLIRGLIEVASRGGNFLLNVGPQPDGQIQPEFQERLRAIGDWLGVNGDAIYGTTYGPIQNVPSFRTTAKNQTVFVHILEWPSSPLTINQLEAKVVSARILDNGLQLNFHQNDTNLRIDLPAAEGNSNVRVVALRTR